MTTNIIFTIHARQRYLERRDKKYDHLSNCNIKQCKICKNMEMDIIQIATKEREKIDAELLERFKKSSEERSYINDTNYTSFLYEKYGYDRRYEFFSDEKLVYVMILQDGEKICVTIIPAKDRIIGRNSRRIKFKKQTKNEEDCMPCNKYA